MSELVPSLVPLDKGLNLQTAKLVAPAGSVLDTLNYEQVDFQGQKRIDGFARYDGRLLSAIDDFLRIELSGASPGVGYLVMNGDELLGKSVGSSGNVVDVAVINHTVIPVVGDTIYTFAGSSDPVERGTAVNVTTGLDSGLTADEHYALLLTYNAVLRNYVEELPGSIIGLHWFRDRLYAVADVVTVSLAETSPVIYPNDTLVVGGVWEAKVLDSYVRDNTRLVFLAGLVSDPWQVDGAAVTRDGISVGTVANGFETVLADEEKASFFESRSEEQTIDEDDTVFDFGWRFVDQGWLVKFDDGVSLYGSLPSLNQNIVGLGVQGPSSVVGNNGRPLVLNQKVTITDKSTQVNGWKSSQSPTSYELEQDNLLDTDGDTIYADAYISWDGTTGEVVAATDTLVEYPATNTVPVEV